MAKTKWVVDSSHSSIDFSVKHMMVSKVKGTFHNFEANIEADPEDLTTADIEVIIDMESIDTRNNDRDGHLKGADFFDIEKYPKMVYKATKIVKTGEGEYELTGDLTIRDTTKPVTVTATYEGQGQDPWGNTVAGFSAEGKFKRSDFGLTYNAALETGGVLIGDEIKLSVEMEAKPA
ncbi:polyisoprenoid-binding protein [Pullulanibacillus camelliae]|uniref:Polyisoprenoid-binding protein n=1 Tax=Pullulanibacillus camelliae TaxID=1707096 RepID=A0A8J2VLP3_9BACL|nr:YceI family protein [Pullulanibacillus camelliae]GGE37035.1 polyisoprenoid-binding protein [Pullulanibacillus camelliae]